MPCCDLKGEGGALDPFAVSRVFAVMIYPNSLDDQNKYLSGVRADVVSGGEQLTETRAFKATKSNRPFGYSAAYLEGLRNYKPSALSYQDIQEVSGQASRQFLDNAERRLAPAGAAGAILLRLLQIERARAATSLNRAMWVVSETRVYKEGLEKVPKAGKQKAKLLKAWREFRSVAHLWAICRLALRPSPLPDQNSAVMPFLPEKLPKFIALAEGLAHAGSQVMVGRGPSREPALFQDDLWRFSLPKTLTQPPREPAIPELEPEALKALENYRS